MNELTDAMLAELAASDPESDTGRMADELLARRSASKRSDATILLLNNDVTERDATIKALRAKVEAADALAEHVSNTLMFGMTDKTCPEKLLRAYRSAGGGE